MICEKFRFLYEQNPDKIEDIASKMQTIAVHCDYEEPWGEIYWDIEQNYASYICALISKDEFAKCFLKLINN